MSRDSQLIDRARQATGLTDFGEDSFREGLAILVGSADRHAKLTLRGAAMFDAMIVGLLSERLRIEHWYALHSEIDEQDIVAPLIGLGLPRTGSTMLSCLLAADPAIRYLRTWESDAPTPPPDAATEADDPRIADAEQRQAALEQLYPRMKEMLPLGASAPIECQNFMGYDFKSQQFLSLFQLPDYLEWLLDGADLVPTYRYVRRVLKLLQWRRPPGRWRLKNPSHTPFIASLVQVFPDARFWMTHREIGSVIPSVVDLYDEMGRAYSDQVDVDFLVRENVEWCEVGLRRLIDFRDDGKDDHFFDVHFADLQVDPIGTVRALYAFHGETLSEAAQTAMEGWLAVSRRAGRSAGDYGAAASSVDTDDLTSRFAFYNHRFRIGAR